MNQFIVKTKFNNVVSLVVSYHGYNKDLINKGYTDLILWPKDYGQWTDMFSHWITNLNKKFHIQITSPSFDINDHWTMSFIGAYFDLRIVYEYGKKRKILLSKCQYQEVSDYLNERIVQQKLKNKLVQEVLNDYGFTDYSILLQHFKVTTREALVLRIAKIPNLNQYDNPSWNCETDADYDENNEPRFLTGYDAIRERLDNTIAREKHKQ